MGEDSNHKVFIDTKERLGDEVGDPGHKDSAEGHIGGVIDGGDSEGPVTGNANRGLDSAQPNSDDPKAL